MSALRGIKTTDRGGVQYANVRVSYIEMSDVTISTQISMIDTPLNQDMYDGGLSVAQAKMQLYYEY